MESDVRGEKLMGWMQALYNTYNKNLQFVGKEEKRYDNTFSLSPISHSTQTAYLEVQVTENGEFHSARVLDKEITLIPASEAAASRAGSVISPLCSA